MWKVFVGFIAFAALAMFVIVKGGDSLDMAGEASGHAPASDHAAPAASAAPPAPVSASAEATPPAASPSAPVPAAADGSK